MIVSLTNRQRDSILEADARINIWSGSVRSGKSIAANIAWLKQIRGGPPGPLLMVGKTHRTLKRNVLDPLHEFLGSRRMVVNTGTGEAKILGRKVYMVGANDERALTKIQGLTLAGAYGDEVTTWPSSFFKMLLSRLSIEGAWFGGTTNPDAPLHWLKREFIDRETELDLKVFQFKLNDNTFLDPLYIESLKKEYTGLWRKRYIDGLWVAAEGPIYDSIDEDRHVIDAIPEGVVIDTYSVGIDYGTSNPFVALLIAHGRNQVDYVIGEYRWDSRARGYQKTDAQYRVEVEKWLPEALPSGAQVDVVWCDPSAASFIVECGQGWLPVMQAKNDVIDGIRLVSSRLTGDRIMFIKGAAHETFEEMQSYAWDQKKQQKGEDAPIKSGDHGPDALRYDIFSHASNSIDVDATGWN